MYSQILWWLKDTKRSRQELMRDLNVSGEIRGSHGEWPGEGVLASECNTMPRHIYNRVSTLTRAEMWRKFLEVLQDWLQGGPFQLQPQTMPHSPNKGVESVYSPKFTCILCCITWKTFTPRFISASHFLVTLPVNIISNWTLMLLAQA